MPPLSLASVVALKPDVVRKAIAGESVVLDLATGMYFGLDETSSRVWELLQAHRSLRPVYDAMLAEFEVDPGRLEHDILAFVGQLTSEGLASIRSAPSDAEGS